MDFLGKFDNCTDRREPDENLGTGVAGQPSDLEANIRAKPADTPTSLEEAKMVDSDGSVAVVVAGGSLRKTTAARRARSLYTRRSWPSFAFFVRR